MPLIAPTPSRFACLPDDDTTDFKPKPDKKKAKKAAANDKGGKPARPARTCGKISNDGDLKAAAFGSKSKGSKGKKGGKNSEKKDEQAFQEWKEKDKKLVDEIYMGDLEKALLQSKVDFEATVSKKQPATTSAAVSTLPKGNKPVPLSLEEFHALDEKRPMQDASSAPESKSAPAAGDDFFDGVAKDAQKVMNREIRMDELKRSCDAGPPPMAKLTNGESHSGGDVPESSSSPNLKISLKLKDTEIAKLKRERDDALDSLTKVKDKNRMLVSILSQAETKEKAQILYKMEQLKAERQEFSSELTRTSTELEQERTKTRELAKELRKYQDKRKSSSKPE